MSRQLEEELVRHRQSTLLAGQALLFLPHSKAFKKLQMDIMMIMTRFLIVVSSQKLTNVKVS